MTDNKEKTVLNVLFIKFNYIIEKSSENKARQLNIVHKLKCNVM